jgi:hypothetical protein
VPADPASGHTASSRPIAAPARFCTAKRFCAKAALGNEVVVADPHVFIVEMYTPGEIVEARRPFDAETAADALMNAETWINNGEHNSTNFRVVDLDGTILIDSLE